MLTMTSQPQENSAPKQGRDDIAAGLTDLQRAVLAFERKHFSTTGAKDEAIRSTFALPAARYYQVLNGTLDEPEALNFDPMLVNRLNRLRDSRTQARSARVFGAN